MAFSSGTYSLYTPGNPVVTGTTIASTWCNNTLNDIATALSTCVLKDGTQTITANIPFSSFRITGLGAATAVTDAARVSQVQNSSFTSLTTVAGTNTITAIATPTPAAYVVGQIFQGIAAGTNTGATTLNVSSLGGGAVQMGGSALVGGEIKANFPFKVFVSAVTPVFQLLSNGQLLTKGSEFAAGTALVFNQTAAPTGWTKGATHNDKALRVVTGTASSGGATAFTSVFGAGKTVGAHTLTTAEIPSHVHSMDGYQVVGGGGLPQSSASATNLFAANTNATGGGGSHDHTLSLDLNYVDVILATKD